MRIDTARAILGKLADIATLVEEDEVFDEWCHDRINLESIREHVENWLKRRERELAHTKRKTGRK